MAKPFLRSGGLDDILALGENGQPVYAVASQLREALRLQQQQEVADCLAIPLVGELGDRIDWYSPFSGPVTSWHAADEKMRADALSQLEKLQAVASAISLRARTSGKASQQLFASLLNKAMQFPDPNALFLVAGKPVVTFWGCVKPGEKTRVDPLDCLRPLEQSPSPVVTAEIIVAPVSAPLPPSLPVETKKPRRLWWLLLPLILLLLAILVWQLRSDQPKNEAQPAAETVITPVEEVVKPVIPLAGQHLPLALAEVLPPPPVITPIAVDKLALQLPADSIKRGSTTFLNGKWRVTVAVKDPLTGKPPSLLYQFKNGKGTVRIVQGDKVTCQTAANAGLMPSGNLVINSRTKARCSNGSRYQMPELVCKLDENGTTECSGRYDSETEFPITIKRETK